MKAYFSKEGRIYEWRKFSNKYVFYLLRRLMGSIIDLAVIIAFIYAATIFMSDPFLKYLIGMLLGMVFATTYYLISLKLMRGQTPGMKLVGLINVNYDGSEPKMFRMMTKGFIMGMYYFPFLGIGFILSSLIFPWLLKGDTLIDKWTKTKVVTVGFYNSMVEAENEYKDKEETWNNTI